MTLLIGQAFEKLFGPDVPIRFTAYDGSAAGDPHADIHFRLLNERGLRYIATAPGSLGLARAYVQGDLAIEGVDEANPYPLLKLLEDEVSLQRPPVRELPELAKVLGWKVIQPPELPAAGEPAAVAEAGQRAAAHPLARRPRRSPTTTTCPTRSTRCCSGRR